MKLSILTACIVISVNALSQNVGIGTSNPQAALHVSTNASAEILRLQGTNPYISFFDGAVYQGYLWHDGGEMVLGSSTNQPVLISPDYNNFAYFTTNGRLGLGTSIPTEVLDVHGNINTTGLIKLNSSAGTAGQVLTSNGAANPTWKNTSFTNTTRFGVKMQDNGTASGNMTVVNTYYNLNTTDITINGTAITINRAGLYHFTAVLEGDVYYFAANYTPTFVPQLYGKLNFFVISNGVTYNLEICRYEPANKYAITTPETRFYFSKSNSGDLYIPANTQLTVPLQFETSSSPMAPNVKYSFLELYGNLISD